MNTINRETFEAWLAAQPEDRVFNYQHCTRCTVGMFIRETTNINHFCVGAFDVSIWKNSEELDERNFSLPEWLIKLLREARVTDNGYSNYITISNLKKVYAEQFPSTKWDLSPSLTSLLNLEKPKVD